MRSMVEAVEPGPLSIAVLGVGTGAVARAFTDHEIFGFDRSSEFLEIAGHALPLATLIETDISKPGFDLSALPEGRKIAVVSCIPVANLSAVERAAFAGLAERLLRDPRVCCFLQYSYLPRMPLDIPGALHEERWVLRNIPPAGIHLWRPAAAETS